MSWWTDFLKWLSGNKPPVNPPPVVPPLPPPSPVKGKLFLWSVGINAYPGAALQGCLNDSFNLAEYLMSKGAKTRQLLDDKATGPAMEAFWREAVAQAGPHDTLVVHYSGHGANGPSGLPDDPGQCLVSAELRPFYASRLGQILANADPDTTVVVVLDCCHSETGTRSMIQLPGRRRPKSIPWSALNASQDPIPSVAKHRAFNLTALARSPQNGIVELAACQANDVTWDANINGELQGCATRAWIDAATDLDKELSGNYTLLTFQAQVQTKLPSPEFPNRPQLQASEWQRNQLMWKS